MDTGGAGQLRDPHDRVLDVTRRDHHQVGELVDHAEDVRQGLVPALQATAADPYDINVVLPITGTFAFVGTTHQKELQVLEGIVNKQGGIQGRPVHFVFHDDTSNPEVSLQIHQGILAKHPAVVFGSSLGALCQATTPLYLNNGPVNYCVSPVIPTTKGS